MTFLATSPELLLRNGIGAPEINDQPWSVRWDHRDSSATSAHTSTNANTADRIAPLFTDMVDFHTSGSTGEARRWRRSWDQLWREAGMLADLVAPHQPDAILSFAPPRHVYGALATILMPAHLGRDVYYRPQYFGRMPDPAGKRWAVVAVPWTYSILLRQHDWLEQVSHLSILHSTAILPSAAEDLLRRLGPEKVSLTEIFGSTETGGIAWRRRSADDPPWSLFADVEFAKPPADEQEIPLIVRSPRLAAGETGAREDKWETGDYVTPDGDRHFRFAGRRERLVKVNGRRINLDAMESELKATLACADLACLPMTHNVSGEHVELLIVAGADGASGVEEVRATIAATGGRLQPRLITFVSRIDRSDSGKPRLLQPSSPTPTEVTE